MLSRSLVAAVRGAGQVRNMSSHYKPPAHFKPFHMDELPLPQGSWKATYEANQRKYNVQLLAGIAFCVGTLVFAKQSELINLNYSLPPLPEE